MASGVIKGEPNRIGTPVRISTNNLYRCSSDGYLQIANGTDKITHVMIQDPIADTNIAVYVPPFTNSTQLVTQTFVKRGMQIAIVQEASGASVYFIPITN